MVDPHVMVGPLVMVDPQVMVDPHVMVDPLPKSNLIIVETETKSIPRE
jgi:hypothetical protein